MPAVFGWGSHRNGQLGFGGIEEENISTPSPVKGLSGFILKQVACGHQHSLFLTTEGTVYSCGNNDFDQLGHDKPRKRPEKVDFSEGQVISVISCGHSHNAAITERGQVLTWGDNQFGQLGRSNDSTQNLETQKLSREVKLHVAGSFPTVEVAVQVACGSQHTMLLTQDGCLFSWGKNDIGQLGQGCTGGHREDPEVIKSIQGLPVKQISCGGDHSVLLTVSGAIYAWGKNSFGQLGLGNTAKRIHPSHIKTLRSQYIQFVSCGEDHTAVLTKDGGVFTFGAGSYGQLGHSATENEVVPKKVFELMGNTVTQIICGRRHTLAFVASTGTLYAFGLGGSGQLGTASFKNITSPSLVTGSWARYDSCVDLAMSLDEDDMRFNPESHVISQVFSGGDHCFVCAYRSEEAIKPIDSRTQLPFGKPIFGMGGDLDLLSQITSISAKDSRMRQLSSLVELIFSSASCINNSFLLPNQEHFCSNSRNSGIDLDAVKVAMFRLGNCDNPALSVLVSDALTGLLPTLPSSPPDIEALRLYLILPQCHVFESPNEYRNLLWPYSKAVLSLDKGAAKVLDKWLAKFSSVDFTKLICIYKRCVLYILEQPTVKVEFEILVRQGGLNVSMEMLKKLNTINDLESIVPYETFYMPQIKDNVDIRADYFNWLQHSKNRHKDTLLSFCHYPFIFDAQAKSLLLQTDAVMQMQSAVDEVNRQNLTNLFIAPLFDPVNPCLVFIVSRGNIVQDTIVQLQKQGSADLKKPMKVLFIGEEAIDEGGVKKEFFMLLLKEILDPKYGMFQYFEDSRQIWFNEKTFEHPTMFFLIGVLCGLAIYNSIIIDIHFPLALFKKLLKRSAKMEDLRELMPEITNNLQGMLSYMDDDMEETFGLTFEITRSNFGEIEHVPLIPGGENMHVNQENKQEYVDAYIDFIFNQSVENPFMAFYDGFHKVCGGRVMDLFHPQELQAMVIGNENYDWEMLEYGCEYKGEYCENHPTMRYFWQAFSELVLAEKKQFLMFLTGSDRIPILGMKMIKMTIQPVRGGEEYLPVAHTCFNLLDLPRYKTKEKLRSKLLQAIEHNQGFALV